MMRAADDPDGAHRHSKACARAVYFSSRMESVFISSSIVSSRADQLSQAWKEGNYTVAEFMSQKIMSMFFRKACGLLTDSRGRHI